MPLKPRSEGRAGACGRCTAKLPFSWGVWLWGAHFVHARRSRRGESSQRGCCPEQSGPERSGARRQAGRRGLPQGRGTQGPAFWPAAWGAASTCRNITKPGAGSSGSRARRRMWGEGLLEPALKSTPAVARGAAVGA